MKKNKNLKIVIMYSLLPFFTICCDSQVSSTTISNTPLAKVSVTPSPRPSTFYKIVEFANRKESYSFLKCLTGSADLSEGKPSLLERDVDNMEKANPPIPDIEAQTVYTKHVNDILRIYPSTFASCKDLKHKEI